MKAGIARDCFATYAADCAPFVPFVCFVVNPDCAAGAVSRNSSAATTPTADAAISHQAGHRTSPVLWISQVTIGWVIPPITATAQA
jgi:hypothetical protein